MLDDFREETDSFDFVEEEDDDVIVDDGDGDDSVESTPEYVYQEPPPVPTKRFMGMTPIQRFVIAVMLLFMVIIMGTFFLLVTDIIVPTFL